MKQIRDWPQIDAAYFLMVIEILRAKNKTRKRKDKKKKKS